MPVVFPKAVKPPQPPPKDPDLTRSDVEVMVANARAQLTQQIMEMPAEVAEAVSKAVASALASQPKPAGPPKGLKIKFTRDDVTGMISSADVIAKY